MGHRMTVLALAVVLSAAAAFAEEAPPRPAPEDLALEGPIYVYGNEATLTVTTAEADADRGLRLVVWRGEEVMDERVVGPFKTRRVKKETTGWAEVTFDASDWPDGGYRAQVHPAGEGQAPGPYATAAFEVVRAKVNAAWEGDLREEAVLWIAHVNRFQGGKWAPMRPNLDRALAEPAALYDDLRGIVMRSYENPHLARRQPYTLYVPEAYDPDEPMPMMVLLHGSGYDYLNIFSDLRNGQEFETHPMLVANAGAFRHQEFRSMALNDVRWVLEDVKRKYRVDADRVYGQGISLGGRGTMELAALAPHLWAAASPQGVYGIMQEPNDLPFYLWQDPWARWSVARWDFRSYLPNLRHVPMQIVYGFKDKTTPPLNALVYAHLLNKRFGGTAEPLGFDRDHHISMPHYNWSDTREWFLKHRRARDPEVVTARTASLRYHRFYWVTIQAMRLQWQMAEVQARLKGDALEVATQNVARLVLEPPRRPERLTIDGQTLDLPEEAPERFDMARDEAGAWRMTEPWMPERRVKRHGQSGPIWDVTNGRCLAVYGTGGTEEETARLEGIARGIARLDAAWGDPSWPVLADADVTEAQRRTCNLMLVGDARTNALLAGQAWPFDLERVGRGDGIDVLGRIHDEPGDTLAFIHPSPWNGEGYVYVVAPARPEGPVRPLNPISTWDLAVWSDWVVRGAAGGGWRGRGGTVDGIFDAAWRLEKMPGSLLQPRPMNWE